MFSSTDPTSLKKMLQGLQSMRAHSLTPQQNSLSSNLLSTSSFIPSNFYYNFMKSNQCMFCRLTVSHIFHKLVIKMGARWCCEKQRCSVSRSCEPWWRCNGRWRPAAIYWQLMFDANHNLYPNFLVLNFSEIWLEALKRWSFLNRVICIRKNSN